MSEIRLGKSVDIVEFMMIRDEIESGVSSESIWDKGLLDVERMICGGERGCDDNCG